jgi:hypothetical protein
MFGSLCYGLYQGCILKVMFGKLNAIIFNCGLTTGKLSLILFREIHVA